jgi:hypothetical protein
MSFTLKIQSKKLFGKGKFDFETMIKKCKLAYGSDNSFYVLREAETKSGTAILYNPQCIGRGIFIDYSESENGKLVISYNIPTSGAEIHDFIRVVKEIAFQMKKVTMYCEEEEREFTLQDLEDAEERMKSFSLEKLNEFCRNPEYASFIFTLAMWPVTLKAEDVTRFAACNQLIEFEMYMHRMQALDVYYASPRLLHNDEKNIYGAFYVLTEDCISIFPRKADDFLNLNDIVVEEGFVQFYLFSEDRIADGLFEYDHFIQYVTENGATDYDDNHVLIPSMTKSELYKMMEHIQMGTI